MISFRKEIAEVLDFTIDWTKYLANSSSDTISTSSWAEDSGGITIDSNSNDTVKATVWLSGGKHGTTYRLENTIVTASSRTAKRYINVKVYEITTNPNTSDYNL